MVVVVVVVVVTQRWGLEWLLVVPGGEQWEREEEVGFGLPGAR